MDSTTVAAESTRTERPRIGVLAIQGDVAEHLDALVRCGADATAVRRPSDLDGLDGIILPGGESTAIGMLAREDGVLTALRRYVDQGGAVWGTCAGLILLARDAGHSQPLIGTLDVTVVRNAFGPQVFSFETDLDIAGLAGGPFRAVFIRAPAISAAGPGVEVLARLDDGRIVAVRQGRLLATAFHPELTGDDRLHRWFVELSGPAMIDPVAHAERQAPNPRRAMRADPSPNSGGGEVNHDEPIRYPPPELGEGQAGQRRARVGGFTRGTRTSPREER